MLKQVYLKVQTVKGELILTPLNCQGLIDNCKVKSTSQLVAGKYYQADLILVNKEFVVDENTLIELPNAPLKGFVYGKTKLRLLTAIFILFGEKKIVICNIKQWWKQLINTMAIILEGIKTFLSPRYLLISKVKSCFNI